MTAADATAMEAESVVETLKGSEAKKNSVVFSPELLAMYYSRLFPYHLLFDWLSYDPTNTSTEKLFARREFSFTIEIAGEEIYIRYQSYSKLADFQAAILQRKPMKIDIGAVFSHPPKDHKAIAQGFRTEQRELVFDIDLTDYDDVRQCGCTGAKICNKCWQMMTMAVKVMEKGLREDFGFKHIAWFYSGRRGIHAWVCDEKARTLSNEARSAVASYFEVRNHCLSTPLGMICFLMCHPH
jgi:DNA primase small subunit